MMGHRHIRSLLPLYASGGLNERERARTETHLRGCAACRAELGEIRDLHALVSAVPPVHISEAELADARARAFAGLHAVRSRPGFMAQTLAYAARPAFRAVSFALAAFALILLGYGAGRYMPPAPGADAAMETSAGDVRVTQLRSFLDDNLRPLVEIGYDRTSREVVRGAPHDPAIQRVLAQALVNGLNPGVRLRAAGAMSGPTAQAPDPEVKAAFLLALSSDTNDGVRKAALEALVRLPADTRIRDALLMVVLHDPNPGLRIAAINGLDSLRLRGVVPDQSAREILTSSSRNDENAVVRVKAHMLLKEN